MKKPNRINGFTLLELLIACALSVLLIGALLRMFVGVSDVVLIAEGTMTATAEARASLAMIEDDFRGIQRAPNIPSFAAFDLILRPVVVDGPAFLEFVTCQIALAQKTSPDGKADATARVEYAVKRRHGRLVLVRTVRLDENDTAAEAWAEDVIAQYLAERRQIWEYYSTADGRYMPVLAETHFWDGTIPASLRIGFVLQDRAGRVQRPFVKVISCP